MTYRPWNSLFCTGEYRVDSFRGNQWRTINVSQCVEFGITCWITYRAVPPDNRTWGWRVFKSLNIATISSVILNLVPSGQQNPIHQPRDCLLNRLFRRRLEKISKLHVAGLCAGNSPVTGEFPAQRASEAENASIWWRHHEFSETELSGTNLLEKWPGCLCLFDQRPRAGTTDSSTTPKRKRWHFDYTFLTGCTKSCHFENFLCIATSNGNVKMTTFPFQWSSSSALACLTNLVVRS